MLESAVLADERLQPLVNEHGAMAVWHASEELLGFPPWQLSTNELLEISQHLESTKNSKRKD